MLTAVKALVVLHLARVRLRARARLRLRLRLRLRARVRVRLGDLSTCYGAHAAHTQRTRSTYAARNQRY